MIHWLIACCGRFTCLFWFPHHSDFYFSGISFHLFVFCCFISEDPNKILGRNKMWKSSLCLESSIQVCWRHSCWFDVGDYAGFPGCGLLRLHSTYRHDLKIYASDEGRVQMTAASFAKVFCNIQHVITLMMNQQ